MGFVKPSFKRLSTAMMSLAASKRSSFRGIKVKSRYDLNLDGFNFDEDEFMI